MKRESGLCAILLVILTAGLSAAQPGLVDKATQRAAWTSGGHEAPVYEAVHLLRFILRAPLVNSEVLYAAVTTYLLLGLLGGFAYELTAVLNPQAIVFTVGEHRTVAGCEALYFSFGVLTN